MSGTVPTATIAVPTRTPRWIDLFRAVLAQCLDDQSVLLATVAKRLTVSTRTLQRMLKTEGTNWRAEVDTMRRAQAGRLLADGMSKAQAAVPLGYSDARALRRAERRWARLLRITRNERWHLVSGPVSRHDMTLMHAMHDALRRELGRIARITARGPGDDPRRILAAAVGWQLFKRYLHTHHTAEDYAIWPVLREELAGRPDDLALIDAMAAEHAAIDPLLAAIDAEVARPDGGQHQLAELTDRLATTLTGHLKHEETEALPLIDATMSAAQWQHFNEVHRIGFGTDTPRLFPWLLDEADDARTEAVFGLLPASVRETYLAQWRPAYVQLDLWRAESST